MLFVQSKGLWKALLSIGVLAVLGACQSSPQPKHLVAGNQYAMDGLLREAVDSYERAIAAQPENLTAHRNLGMVLVKTGQYAKAIHHLAKALEQYKDDFEAHFFLAEAYRAEEKYADAIFHYQTTLRLRSQDAKTLKALAWTYFKIRYYGEALSTAEKLQKLQPLDPQVSLIMARTQIKLKRHKDALATLRAGQSKAGGNQRPYFLSVGGDLYFELGKLEKAHKLYSLALKDQPLLPGALLGLGKYHLSQQRPEEAVPPMEKAVRLRPNLAEAYFLLGKAYEALKQPQKSLQNYQHFRKHASTDPEFLSILSEVNQKIGSLRQGLQQREQTPKKL